MWKRKMSAPSCRVWTFYGQESREKALVSAAQYVQIKQRPFLQMHRGAKSHEVRKTCVC